MWAQVAPLKDGISGSESSGPESSSPESSASIPQGGQPSAPWVDRLPITVILDPSSLPPPPSSPTQPPAPPIIQGIHGGIPPTGALGLEAVQPSLALAVPYYDRNQHQWHPVLQRGTPRPTPSGDRSPAQLPLIWIRQSLEALLTCFQCPPGDQVWGWQPTALGLTPTALHQAMTHLEGVVVNLPQGTTEAYSFNVREAILGAGLVAQPEQVYFLETAIAAFLPLLHSKAVQGSLDLRPNPSPLGAGSTLIVHGDGATTELALVQVPPSPTALTHGDFSHGSLAYGEQALDQDIVTQLLYPLLPPGRFDFDPQGFPVPGEADLIPRSRLHHYLTQAPLGRLLLEAATQLRLVLQQQPQFTLRIGAATHTLTQEDLAAKVLKPYCSCLNSVLNQLLSHQGLAQGSLNQVVLTGHAALLPHLLPWLHQKFPLAQLITGDRTPGMPQVPSPGHALASGLAHFPLYPQLVNPAAQYSRTFLLLEILRACPPEPLSLSQVCQRLETRGINTQLCQGAIQDLLQGHLPKGLVPDGAVAGYFTPESWGQTLYVTLRSQPLFIQPSPHTYQINLVACQAFYTYWQILSTHNRQTLAEPYLWQLAYA